MESRVWYGGSCNTGKRDDTALEECARSSSEAVLSVTSQPEKELRVDLLKGPPGATAAHHIRWSSIELESFLRVPGGEDPKAEAASSALLYRVAASMAGYPAKAEQSGFPQWCFVIRVHGAAVAEPHVLTFFCAQEAPWRQWVDFLILMSKAEDPSWKTPSPRKALTHIDNNAPSPKKAKGDTLEAQCSSSAAGHAAQRCPSPGVGAIPPKADEGRESQFVATRPEGVQVTAGGPAGTLLRVLPQGEVFSGTAVAGGGGVRLTTTVEGVVTDARRALRVASHYDAPLEPHATVEVAVPGVALTVSGVAAQEEGAPAAPPRVVDLAEGVPAKVLEVFDFDAGSGGAVQCARIVVGLDAFASGACEGVGEGAGCSEWVVTSPAGAAWRDSPAATQQSGTLRVGEVLTVARQDGGAVRVLRPVVGYVAAGDAEPATAFRQGFLEAKVAQLSDEVSRHSAVRLKQVQASHASLEATVASLQRQLGECGDGESGERAAQLERQLAAADEARASLEVQCAEEAEKAGAAEAVCGQLAQDLADAKERAAEAEQRAATMVAMLEERRADSQLLSARSAPGKGVTVSPLEIDLVASLGSLQTCQSDALFGDGSLQGHPVALPANPVGAVDTPVSDGTDLDTTVRVLQEAVDKAEADQLLESQNESLAVALREAVADKEAAEARVAQGVEEKEALVSDYNQAMVAMQDTVEAVQAQLDQAEREHATHREQAARQLREKGEQLASLRDVVASKNTTLETLKREAVGDTEDIDVLRAQLEHRQKEVEAAGEDLRNATAASLALHSAIEERDEHIRELEEQCCQDDTKEEAAQAVLQAMSERIADLEAQQHTSSDATQQLQEALQTLQAEHEALQTSAQHSQAAADTAQQQARTRDEEAARLQQALVEATAEKESAVSRVASLLEAKLQAEEDLGAAQQGAADAAGLQAALQEGQGEARSLRGELHDLAEAHEAREVQLREALDAKAAAHASLAVELEEARQQAAAQAQEWEASRRLLEEGYDHSARRSESTAASLRSRLEEQGVELADARGELEGRDTRIADLQGVVQMHVSHIEALSSKLSTARQEADAELHTLAEQLQATSTSEAALRQEVAALESRHTADTTDVLEEVQALREESRSSAEIAELATAEAASLRRGTAALEASVGELRSELRAKQQQVDQMAGRLQIAEASRDASTERYSAELDNARTLSADDEKVIESLRKKLKSSESEAMRLRSQLMQSRRESSTISEDHESLKRQFDDVRKALFNKEKRLVAVEVELAQQGTVLKEARAEAATAAEESTTHARAAAEAGRAFQERQDTLEAQLEEARKKSIFSACVKETEVKLLQQKVQDAQALVAQKDRTAESLMGRLREAEGRAAHPVQTSPVSPALSSPSGEAKLSILQAELATRDAEVATLKERLRRVMSTDAVMDELKGKMLRLEMENAEALRSSVHATEWKRIAHERSVEMQRMEEMMQATEACDRAREAESLVRMGSDGGHSNEEIKLRTQLAVVTDKYKYAKKKLRSLSVGNEGSSGRRSTSTGRHARPTPTTPSAVPISYASDRVAATMKSAALRERESRHSASTGVLRGAGLSAPRSQGSTATATSLLINPTGRARSNSGTRRSARPSAAALQRRVPGL